MRRYASPSPSSGRAGWGSCHGTRMLKQDPTLPSPKTGREKPLPHPMAPPRLAAAQVRDDGPPGDRGLAYRRERAPAFGQIDIDARAEPDHADALAGPDAGALLDERHDAPRHQAGDLDDADLGAAGGGDHQAVALVIVARLVEIGVDEGTRP